LIDLKIVLLGILSKEIFADVAGIPDRPIKPCVLAEEKTASRRLDPTLGHPIA
jgi:hypothetical protein